MNLQNNLKKYLEFCKYRKELSPKTIKAYRIDLTQYLHYISENALQKEKIEDYITQLHKKYKQKTVKRKIASIKAFYRYLEDAEIIKENPFHKIPVRFKETVNLPRIIPREEIEQLLNCMYKILDTSSNVKKNYILRDIAVIEMFFATGARVYEISGIKKECIDLNTGLVRFMGKGGKERYVQISNSHVLKILRKYYVENETSIKKSGYFFINQRGNRYT